MNIKLTLILLRYFVILVFCILQNFYVDYSKIQFILPL